MALSPMPLKIPPIALPLGASLLFAGSFIAGKYTTADLLPLTTSLWRYLAALLFLTGMAWRLPSLSLTVARRDLLPLSLLGLSGIVGYHYFFFSSLRYTAVINTAIINATNPIITSIAAAIILGETLAFKNYLGGAIAFLGVILLLTGGNLQNLITLQFNQGDGLMLLAVLCWVAYSLLLKRLSRRYSGFTLTYYAALFGVIFLLLLAAPEHPITQLRTSALSSQLGILYMGIGTSGLGYLQYNLSVIAIGATRTACIIYSFVPIFVALLSLLFFGVAIAPLMLLIMALIIAGVNLMLTPTPE
ncbi:DMT family transporter [Spirulina major]|uniref:DMT family transporter n=1 Tax=Spirulina major TaxID=270636 RepID=UPI0009343EF5|nr:DMT family transporter [Spirulina major]